MSLRRAVEALDRAPGPSPWAPARDTPVFPDGASRGRWDRRELRGVHYPVLLAPDGSERMVLGYGTFVRPLNPPRLLLWHTDPASETGSTLHVRLFDVDALRALTGAEPPKHPFGVWAHGGLLGEIRVQLPLGTGPHPLDVPPTFAEVGEVLAIAHGHHTGAVILSICPAERLVQAFPQDWYNDADLDFGYQWLASVARHPDTGRLCVRGVRMGSFILDATGRQVETRV